MAPVQPDQSPAAPWNPAEYAQKVAPTHRAFDDWFLRRHPVRRRDNVVDLGCGTGEFTAHLAALADEGSVTGIDVDSSMISAARHHQSANLAFVLGAAEKADALVPAASVDLVVSRAMLQWLPATSLPRTFAAVFAILRPGGWFHCECPGTGQTPALMKLLDALAHEHGVPVWPGFPDTGTTFELLEQAGFSIPEEGVRTVAQRRSFTREGVCGYLTTGAIHALTRHIPDGAGREALICHAASRVDELRRHDGSFDATNVRLQLLVQRPP